MAIDWNEYEPGYADQMQNDVYHIHRTNFILRLFPENVTTVVDFGCGEGFYSELMVKENLAKNIIALDPSLHLIEIAKSNEVLSRNTSVAISQGGVEELKDIASGSSDLVLALNVLAYMTKEEEDLFYKECNRIVKVGGALLVTHSNELFDMFTLNNLTIDFFLNNFHVNIKEFLNLDECEIIQTYGIRENPLSYSSKLVTYGFQQEKIDFFHHHNKLPRAESVPSRNKILTEIEMRDTNAPIHWTEYFQSSTFGVLARKTHTR